MIPGLTRWSILVSGLDCRLTAGASASAVFFLKDCFNYASDKKVARAFSGAGMLSSRGLGPKQTQPFLAFPSYEGRVMCGYQGWFRAEGDGSGEGWSHYSERGPLTAASLHPDLWPDVSEYEKTYPTASDQHRRHAPPAFSVPGTRARRTCISAGCATTELTACSCSGSSA